MPKRRLKTQITLAIALFSVVLVAMVSISSHKMINKRFVEYISRQQEATTDELLSSLSAQYYMEADRWDLDFIHTIGMYALYGGYIISVNDLNGGEIWDAQTHDMSMCYQVMNDIQRRMELKYPSVDGKFTVASYPLVQEGHHVGNVDISYYGPYFLSENDFGFLEALNIVCGAIALAALAISVLLGWAIAGRISRPVLRAVNAVEQVADGDYTVRLEEGGITELEQLAESVNQLAAALGKQEHLRRQLTADVAHELRTPLTAIGTQLETMMEGVWEPTPLRLQGCHEEVLRLGKLVADLENLARAEEDSLRLQIQPVNCMDCVQRVLEAFTLEINKKDLMVSVVGAPELSAMADPDRLRQVLNNLLVNAVKYTPEGGKIQITAQKVEEFVQISVEDSGEGISADDLPQIFERFYRADRSRSRSTGGAGIGLAVVKTLVTAQGGQVWAESELGKGSIFCIRLPSVARGETDDANGEK